LTMQRWAHKVDECLLEAEAQAERVVKLLEAVVNVLQGRWANGIPDCQVRRPRRELVARSILFIVQPRCGTDDCRSAQLLLI
jgi:hypothetical protein